MIGSFTGSFLYVGGHTDVRSFLGAPNRQRGGNRAAA